MKKVKEMVDKVPFGKISLEIFSIVFAILFALAINEWNDNRNNQKLAKESLENIKTELQENLKIVSDLLTKNVENYKNQQKAFINLKNDLSKKDSNLDAEQLISKFPLNFEVNNGRKTAWQTAGLTQAIRYFKPDITQRLSGIYERQDDFFNLSNQLLNMYASPRLYDTNTMNSQLQACFSKYTMYFSLGQNLVDSYQKCLEHINKELQN